MTPVAHTTAASSMKQLSGHASSHEKRFDGRAVRTSSVQYTCLHSPEVTIECDPEVNDEESAEGPMRDLIGSNWI